MDPQAAQVAAAVDAIQAASTPAAVRAEAQAFADAFKESPEALNHVVALTGAENSDAVRHYGLSVLEFALKYSWRSFDGGQQAMIKQMILELIDSGTKSLTDEIHYVKNKLVDVLLLALLHDWPQRWPDLFPLLTELGAKSDTQAELVLRIFCDTSEELLRLSRAVISGQDSNVTVARRKQLCDAFRDSMEILYPFLWGCLAQQVQLYEAAKAACAAGSDEAIGEFGAKALLLDATMKGMVSLLNWIPLELLDERPVLPLTMPLITDPNIAMLAVETMDALLSRKFVRSSESHIMRLCDYVPELLAVLSNGRVFEVFDKQHAFNLGIVNVLVELGLYQFRLYQRTLVESGGAEAPVHAGLFEYIQAMMQLGEAHPSLEVHTALLTLWRALLTSGLIPSDARLSDNELLLAILQIQLRLLLLRNPWNVPGPEQAFAQLDYSSEEDAQVAWKTIERRATALLSVLTRYDGHGMVEFAGQYLAHVMSTIDLGSMEYVKGSDEVRALRAAGALFTIVLRSLPRHCLVASDPSVFSLEVSYVTFELFEELPEPKSAEQVAAEEEAKDANAGAAAAAREVTVEGLAAALEATLSFHPVAPALLSGKLRVIAGFAPFLKHFPGQLVAAFQAAFEQIMYRHPTEAGVHVERLGADSLRVRVKATKTVRLLFLYVGESMAGMLEQVWARLQELEGAGELRHEETVSLHEVVLISASKSREDTLQVAVVNAILAPVLAQWCSPELAGTIGDVRTFLTCLGLVDNPAPEPSFTDEHLTYRSDLYFLVSVLYIVTKWSAGWRSRPLADHLSSILTPLFSLLVAAHQIWLPEVLGQLPPAYQALARVPDETDSTELARASALPQGHLDSASQLRLFVYWLDSLQSRCYSILGCATKFRDLFFVPELPALLAGSVFSCLQTLPSRFLAALHVSVVGPLIRMVPAEARDAVVLPFLLQWLEFLQAKLPAEWQAFYTRQESDDKQMTPEEEVLVDTALSRLTVVHARMLQSLSFRLPRAPSDPADGVDSTGEARVPHLLETEPMRSLFLQSSLILLQCPVLTASSIAVTLAQRLLQHIIGIAEYQYPLCTELLPALLTALTHNEDETMLRKVLTLIGDIYVALTPVLPDLTRSVLASVPGVTMEALAALEQELGSTETLRDRREAFRELLGDTIGTNIIHRMYKLGEAVKEIDVIAEVDTTDGGL